MGALRLHGPTRRGRRLVGTLAVAGIVIGAAGCLPPPPPPQAVVSITTKPIDFGPETGASPFAELVAISNRGNVAMTHIGAFSSGPDMSELSVGAPLPPVSNCLAPGFVLLPNEACGIVVLWQPAARPATLSGDTLSVVGVTVGTGVPAMGDSTSILGSAS